MKILSYLYAKIIIKMRGRTIKQSNISKKSKISSGSWVINSTIDDYSYTGYDCRIFDVEMGKYCSIGQNVSIGVANHPSHFVSTSPLFYSQKNIFNGGFNQISEKSIKTIIQDDVFIGSGSYIKSGITIEKGAIIGMGSIVTKNVGPYEVWAGNPARFIKKRFDEKTIETLLKINWQNWDLEIIKEKANLFLDVDAFINKENKAL